MYASCVAYKCRRAYGTGYSGGAPTALGDTSALNSHRSDDPWSKVGRWLRFGPATVLNDIALSA